MFMGSKRSIMTPTGAVGGALSREPSRLTSVLAGTDLLHFIEYFGAYLI